MADETKQHETKEVETDLKEQAKEKKEGTKLAMTKEQEDFVSRIENMSVIELSSLVKVLEDRFDVSAQAPMMVAAAGVGGAAGAAAAEEEKSTFDVVLSEIGANKIQVIKEIRAVTSLGLKEAKDLVEAAPKAIKEGIPKAEAEEIKKKIEATGAKAELK
jgi:large subunit ribosomal protein L7/L12